jgi:hypothetical protein
MSHALHVVQLLVHMVVVVAVVVAAAVVVVAAAVGVDDSYARIWMCITVKFAILCDINIYIP